MAIRLEAIQDDYYGLVNEYADMFISDYKERYIEYGKAGDDLYEHIDEHVHTYLDDSFIYVGLLEAATIIEESTYEETDSGLWEAQKPEDAIVTKAFFTMRYDLMEEVKERVNALLLAEADELDKEIVTLENLVEKRDAEGADEGETQSLVDKIEDLKTERDELERVAGDL
jgi:hypothetical protein